MPHYTVKITEETLDGSVEPRLIRSLTDAAVEVYGEEFRERVVVDLFGIPRARWGTGGEQAAGDELDVTLHLREGAFTALQDAPRRLIRAISDAAATVLGDGVRARVHLVGVPQGRTGVGGVPA